MQFENKIKERRDKNPFVQNTDLAYDLLLECIISGELKPGDKILQDEYANKLNMSRTPIRDALIQLERDGYIRGSGQKSFAVSQIYYSDYAEIRKFRSLLEEYAVRYAVKNFDEAYFQKMSSNIKKMQELKKEPDRVVIAEKFLSLDFEFHELIVLGSSNKYLINAYNAISPRYHFYQSIIRREEYNLLYTLQTHKRIYEAIYDRDEERAARLIREHCGFYDTVKIQKIFEKKQQIR